MLKPVNALKKNYFHLPIKAALPQRAFYSGLIGCGHIVKCAYVPVLNRRGNPIVLMGLYSRSVRSSEHLKRMLRYKTNVFTSYEDLINSGIRSVIITAPNHLHSHYIIQSLSKGLDVFCEKPVANSLQETHRIIDTVGNSQNILMVGFNQRYSDRIRKLKSLLDSGHIGEVKEIHAFHNQNIKEHLLGSDWLNDTQKSGGGVIHNAAIHLVNIMIYLFGKVDGISAEFKNIEMPSDFGEDTASCRLAFESGIAGFLNASLVNAVDSTYEHMVITTNLAVITTDMRKCSITLDNGGRFETIPCKRETIADTIYNELMHFNQCISKRKRPETDIYDSLETLRVIQAIYMSGRECREVHLNEIENRYN